MKFSANKSVLMFCLCAIIFGAAGSMSLAEDKKTAEPEKAPAKDTQTKSDDHHYSYKERLMESIAEYVEWLKQEYPEEALNLQKIKENSPDIYIRHVYMSKNKYGAIMDTQKKNPPLAEVMKEDIELNELRTKLVEQIKKAQGKEAEKLTKKLENVVSTRFDLLVKKKQLQYEYLERRLESLKKQIAKQKEEVQKLKENKEQATKERMEELLSDKEQVNWDK